jgi:anti-sigma-K factor RskA
MSASAVPLTQDDIALAAELAMRLLSPADEAQARARMTRDAAFAAEVQSWEERLMPMTAGLTAAPPDHVWQKIEAQIAPVASQDKPAPVRFWQGLSLVSMAAAAVLGVMLINQPMPNPPAPSVPMIAALSAEGGTAAVTASFDASSGELIITPVSLDTGALYPELWVIPAGGTATSLGMIKANQPSRHSLPEEMRQMMAKGATLAITPEPAGGAPGGKATGPVIASGKMMVI